MAAIASSLFPLPVWADFIIPAIGMESADQDGVGFTTTTVGHAVIVDTVLTGFGARWRNFIKAKLRSQNVLLALLLLPAVMGRFSQVVVGVSEGVGASIHGSRA